MALEALPVLADPKTSIRLMRCVASSDSEVECTITPFVLKNAPPFTAMSYQWGEVELKQIILNKHVVSVRINLWQLLHEIRGDREWNQKWFWIDAICINQQDVNERNHQVSAMRRIYSSAEHVIIWLGPAQAESDLAMQYLAQRKYISECVDRQCFAGLGLDMARKPHAPSKMAKSRSSKRMWSTTEGKALLGLFQRPYFTRIWIVQEIIFARRLTLFCGSERLPWVDLDKFFRIVEQNRFGGSVAILECGQEVADSEAAIMVQEKRLWDQGRWDKRRDITTLIALYGRRKSTEVVDKVFALSGISCSKIEIDYSLSAKQVFEMVLQDFCLSDNGPMHSKELFANNLADALGLHPFNKPLLSVADILNARSKASQHELRSTSPRPLVLQMADGSSQNFNLGREATFSGRSSEHLLYDRTVEMHCPHPRVPRTLPLLGLSSPLHSNYRQITTCSRGFYSEKVEFIDGSEPEAECIDHLGSVPEYVNGLDSGARTPAGYNFRSALCHLCSPNPSTAYNPWLSLTPESTRRRRSARDEQLPTAGSPPPTSTSLDGQATQAKDARVAQRLVDDIHHYQLDRIAAYRERQAHGKIRLTADGKPVEPSALFLDDYQIRMMFSFDLHDQTPEIKRSLCLLERNPARNLMLLTIDELYEMSQ